MAILASTEGGVEIEEVAAKTPEKIVGWRWTRAWAWPRTRPGSWPSPWASPAEAWKQALAFLRNLYRLFVEKDCSMVEINPLVVTAQGDLTALDAKIAFDDNALFRHPEIKLYLPTCPRRRRRRSRPRASGSTSSSWTATSAAWSTAPAWPWPPWTSSSYHGGTPANFLDVGGGASEEAVKNAFRIILQDPGVKAVLVNIFGGIMRCDVVAKGIVNASREIGIRVPVVARLEGTNVEEGKRILQDSGLKILVGANLEDAAAKVVAAVQ